MEMTNQALEHLVDSLAIKIQYGVKITDEDIEDWNEIDITYQVGDIVRGADFIEDRIDIKYVVDADRRYLSAQLLMKFGGPNLYIDTNKRVVKGYWGCDEFIKGYWEDPMNIEQACEELYQQAG